jgi:CTD small phosphatase-like protein 2
MYIKDLRVIQNREMKNIVLVDNAPYSYYFQMENGVPIVPYYDCKEDVELLQLEKFLMEKVHPCDDVRPVLKEYFKLHRYIEYTNISQLIEALYIMP